MTSKLKIINAAMLLLGHNSVNDIGDDSPEAVIAASNLYDIYYPSILSSGYWRFAIKQQELAQINNPDSFDGWNYAYQIPVDFIAIEHIEPVSNYIINGTSIYSNISQDLKLYYFHEVSEGILPVYFVTFIIEKMAAIFAMKITQQPQLAQFWEANAAKSRNTAIQLDRNNQPSMRMIQNPIANAKYFSPTGY